MQAVTCAVISRKTIDSPSLYPLLPSKYAERQPASLSERSHRSMSFRNAATGADLCCNDGKVVVFYKGHADKPQRANRNNMD